MRESACPLKCVGDGVRHCQVKAVVYRSYGPPRVLALEDVNEPATTGLGRVRVRVHAAGLNPKDVLVRKGKYKLLTGPRFPKGFGYDYAGEVIASSASGFQPGDRVFGMVQAWNGSTCAEQITVRAKGECARMPRSLSWEQAAAIPLAAQTALQALRDIAGVTAGTRLLINGASGGVGTFAIQIARALGAHVTAVSSATNEAFCRELGAHDTVDYRLASPFEPASPRDAYDAIFDVFGNGTFARARRALRPHGIYVTTVPSRRAFLDIAATLFSPQRARLVYVRTKSADLAYLAALADEGRLRPIIHQVFPLEDVQAAAAQIETKRTRGKVVLRMPPST